MNPMDIFKKLADEVVVEPKVIHDPVPIPVPESLKEWYAMMKRVLENKEV